MGGRGTSGSRNSENSVLDLSKRTNEQLDALYESAATSKDVELMKDIRVARSIKERGFGAKMNASELTITGSKGTFTFNFKENSTRTKAYKQFISSVLAAYGTEGVNEIMYWEERR